MGTGFDGLIFEWDENKNIRNIEKHGISFETASRVFLDPDYLDIFDENHSTLDEDRHIIIGRIDRVLFVVCIFRKDSTRLISARLANKKEEKVYYGR